MFQNFLKLIIRNILKNKVITVINLSNLVIGFATFILFSVYIFYELNWDKQNKNYDNIYRVQLRIKQADNTELRTYTPPALYFHILDSIVGIENKLLLKEAGNVYLGVNQGDWIFDNTGYVTTNEIFNIFTYHFIQGDPVKSLLEPNSIVISEKLAKKLFPDGNAFGKIIIGEKKFYLKVTGVYKDLPENSIIRPNFLISFSTVDNDPDLKDIRDDYMNIVYDTYVLLYRGTDPLRISAKMNDTFNGIKDRDKYYPYLRPLSKLYTAPNQSDMLKAISILSFGALLILILACVNYVNLTTANMSRRALEIAVKKVSGSSRNSLIVQFLSETVIMTIIASAIAVILAQLFIPTFKEIIGRPMNLNLLKNTGLLASLFFISVLLGLISGIYPALVLSSLNPVKILKGKVFSDFKGTVSVKKVLMIAQFSISLYMILSSFIIFSQIHLMTHKSLGFKDKDLLYAYIKGGNHVSYDALRNQLMNNPDITDVSFSRTIPFNGNIGGYFGWDNSQPDEKVLTSRNYVSNDFLSTYGLELVKGRNFTKGSVADRESILINETALKAFGWDDIAGKNVIYFEKPLQVIGVIRDFHVYSIHNPVPPYIVFSSSDSINGDGYYSVRFKHGSITRVKKFLQEEMQSFYPESVFEFNDLESSIQNDKALTAYRSFGRISSFFTILTLFTASIGLFGLILFSVKRKTKEIGVRKIFGSSVFNIFRILSMEILKMIGIAVILVCPLAWYEHEIIPSFYKSPLSLWEFLAAILIMVIVSLLTISWHIYQAAKINPIEALRYE